jgi:hypothetical protein
VYALITVKKAIGRELYLSFYFIFILGADAIVAEPSNS